MATDDASGLQQFLIERLQHNRDAVLWKIDGVDEYDLRRPLTPTGTNLLGLVKHLTDVELGYFGDTFGRRSAIAWNWSDEELSDNADMWATADESVDDVVSRYQRAWDHARETFRSSDLQTTGTVQWWSEEHNPVTLGEILIHVLGETARHAGHMDILREGLDGAAGLYLSNDNMAHNEADALSRYVAKLQSLADSVKGTR